MQAKFKLALSVAVLCVVSACTTTTPAPVKNTQVASPLEALSNTVLKKPRPPVEVKTLKDERQFVEALADEQIAAINLAMGASSRVRHAALLGLMTNTLKGSARELAALRDYHQQNFPQHTLDNFVPSPTEFVGSQDQIVEDTMEKLLAQQEKTLLLLLQADKLKLSSKLRALVYDMTARQKREASQLLLWSEQGLPAIQTAPRKKVTKKKKASTKKRAKRSTKKTSGKQSR